MPQPYYSSTYIDPWYAWNTAATSGITYPTTSHYIWTHWVETTQLASQSRTWSHWVDAAGGTGTYVTGRIDYYPAQTPEQLAAVQRQHDEQMQRYQVQVAAQAALRDAAERRARELLEANLSQIELQRFRTDGHILLHGRSGCRYRIRKGRSANVDVIDRAGFITHRLCAHPIDMVPDHDTMLAQLLLLQHDEAEFLRMANRHPLYAREPQRVLEALP